MRSVALTVAFVATNVGIGEDRIDFRRDIKPLLAAKCSTCHGPDENKRQADRRFDTRGGFFGTKELKPVVVAGNVSKSELIRRLTTKDDDERMPPGQKLTKTQIETIKKWISQGAKWETHWAYVPPKRPNVPKINDGWSRGAIDILLRERQRERSLKPSPDASRRVLIRRLSFDLLGMPPSPQEVAAFINDKSPKAYENLVDRLMKSPHFGERMGQMWLDLVRYADTNGIHGDNHRDHFLYRDYVISSFNSNKPFDRFTIEQLAGDLLPATDPAKKREQLIASGYNRLLMTTREGGAQAREYRAKYAADRVRNASEVWMASTLGCAQCHTHKFDPFPTRDFYRFAAFFADIRETAVGKQNPRKFPTKDQQKQIDELAKHIAAAEESFRKPSETQKKAFFDWLKKPAGKLPGNIKNLLAVPENKRNAKQRQQLLDHFRNTSRVYAAQKKAIDALKRRRAGIEKRFALTLVTETQKPMETRVLPRGNWLDDSGEIVTPGAPSIFAKSPTSTKTKRLSRLDLAKWLTSPDHPMTSRVMVNRLWALFFGRGLVKSKDDFGAQTPPPTHPRLLDWLAVEFAESGWNVKHIVKTIVLSRAYQQSSRVPKNTPDPANLFLSRQNSWRLDAEAIRDIALKSSGLLVPTIGGPSVKPYQPAGYWRHLNFPRRAWKADTGERVYRRGLYIYWCRTFLHPAMKAFDAPTREECSVDRPRSNTPLQALVLLNDPTYVEAARKLAAHVISEAKDERARLSLMFQRILQREPDEAERTVMMALFASQKKAFKDDPKSASESNTVGQYRAPATINDVELASWTSVSRVLMNLHESVLRE